MNMGCNIDESAVIILAAGTSGRMGFHKPLLSFNDDESFLERIFNMYTEADIGQVPRQARLVRSSECCVFATLQSLFKCIAFLFRQLQRHLN